MGTERDQYGEWREITVKKGIQNGSLLKIPVKEKKKKNSINIASPIKVLLLFGFTILLFVILDWVKWDFIYDTNNLIKGFVIIGLWIIFLVIILCFLFYIFQYYSLLIKLITSGMILLIIGIFFIFPYTKTYRDLNYIVLKEEREETLEMLKNDDLEQFDETQYKAPFRLISHTNTLDVLQRNGRYEVYFSIYRGLWKNSVLIYSSDEKMPNTDRGTSRLTEIIKVDSHWYTALEIQN